MATTKVAKDQLKITADDLREQADGYARQQQDANRHGRDRDASYYDGMATGMRVAALKIDTLAR